MTIAKAAARDDLSTTEREALARSAAFNRRALALARARAALREGRADARRRSFEVAFGGGFGLRTRLKALAAAVAPGRARRELERQPVRDDRRGVARPADERGLRVDAARAARPARPRRRPAHGAAGSRARGVRRRDGSLAADARAAEARLANARRPSWRRTRRAGTRSCDRTAEQLLEEGPGWPRSRRAAPPGRGPAAQGASRCGRRPRRAPSASARRAPPQ